MNRTEAIDVLRRLDALERRVSWILARIPADTPPANGLYADGFGPEMREPRRSQKAAVKLTVDADAELRIWRDNGPGRPSKDAAT